MTHNIRFEPVETWIYGADEARLVFIENKLGAVIVRLGPGYGDLANAWNAEAAFNSFEGMAETTFPNLDAVEKWIRWRLSH